MARIIKVPNDQANQVLMMAAETLPGVMPTSGWVRANGQPEFQLGPPALSDYRDATGTYMGKSSPSRGTRIPTGNFSAPATFEGLPRFGRMSVESGEAPASGTGPDYTYIQEPPLTVDDVDTYTMLFNHLGNGFQATGVRFQEINIATDVDNADGFWDVSGTIQASEVDQLAGSFEGLATGGSTTTVVSTSAAWTIDEWEGAFIFLDYGTGRGEVRQIVSNTADTATLSTPLETAPTAGDTFRIAGQFPAGVAAMNEEKIPNAVTRVWILPAGSTPDDDNNIRRRIISANMNLQFNLDAKVFLENAQGTTSGIFGRGEMIVSGQIRMEFDRYDELAAAKAMDEMLIRIESQGSDLGGGVPRMARMETTRAVWNEHSRDTRNNNLTQTLSFWGYEATPPFILTTRNGLATLG